MISATGGCFVVNLCLFLALVLLTIFFLVYDFVLRFTPCLMAEAWLVWNKGVTRDGGACVMK
jgi:hypothetical protein